MGDDSNVQSWATAISKNASNGRQIIFRFAEKLSPSFDRSSQPDRIIIVWKYTSENGQPIADKHQKMNVLEDTLEPILEQDQFATLALVSTGENLREWIYYAKSEEKFLDRLNLALGRLPAFPIEIHTASDPTWANYDEFIAGLKTNGHIN